MKQLTVELGTRSYPVIIGNTILDQLLSLLNIQRQVFIISNPTIEPLYFASVRNALGSYYQGHFLMPDGEQYKTLDTFRQAMDAVMASGLHRDGIILALGGGVVGDLAGFVAATFQRGVSLIQVPTTLLSQVDSSVGGKTAVNHALGKNMIGAFHQPDGVLIDTASLHTLADCEFRAGIAEIIKYGVIDDSEFFDWLELNITALLKRDEQALQHAIAVSCKIKARIVANDEREQGQRALLNFGHTFGHVIETHEGYGNWLHGEAVAAGMVIATHLASVMNWCTASDFRRVHQLVAAAGLPTKAPEINWSTWQAGLYRDKKVKAGQVRFILPTAIGSARITSDPVDDTLLQASVTLT
ncbi:MAG TPA: 3-dehydroquinate synthase [Aliidiomarina sp.]|nr:3-dehydroquinate synthase [Aliidiomarina sp.]